jgi:hypothetical protein
MTPAQRRKHNIALLPKTAFRKLPARVRQNIDEFEFHLIGGGSIIEALYGGELIAVWTGRSWTPAQSTLRDLSHALPGGLEFTDAERRHMERMTRRSRKLRALRRGALASTHSHFQSPRGTRDPRRGRFYRRDPNNPDDQLGLPFGTPVVTDVLGRTRAIDKMWPDGSYNCPFCWAAVKGGGPCQNPACVANPRYPAERAREDVARAEARKREEEEREKSREWSKKYQEERRREEEERAQAILAEAKKRGACLRCLDLRHAAVTGRKPKFVKHRKACPKEGRDPRRTRRARRDGYVVPRGGATHGRTLNDFTTEVRALLFSRGFGPYKVDQIVASGKAWIWDAWRKHAPPCAVADAFAGRMRRDPRRKKRKIRRRR